MPAATSLSIDAARLKAIVQAVPAGAGWASHIAACRELDTVDKAEIPQAISARVALIGSGTLDPLVAFLRVEGARVGLWLEVYLAPYGQYLQELLDPSAGVYAFEPHVTFLMVGGEVLWEMRWAQPEPVASAVLADQFVGSLRRGLDTFTERGTGALFVNELTSPLSGVEALISSSSTSFQSSIGHANQLLGEELTERPSCYFFPLDALLAETGRQEALDCRMRYRGDVLWTDVFMGKIGRRYAAMVAAVRGHATKCLVLDLDNTLWGGVLGEEGAGGIVIGPERPGREFLDFQRQLLELQRQGFMLAVCSKNNEHEVMEIFRAHPDQLIREEHLAAHRINWQDKATNLREIAAELNIGLEHMMFLDDSPHEREWVRSQVPEILVPDLPSDPSSYPDWLASLPSLVVLDQTAEDGGRTQQYHQQRVRKHLENTTSSQEEFLRQLELRVEIALLEEATLPRIVQLLAKTNQFNLTTRRHDAMTLHRNVEAGSWRVYTMRVADRFGDFGLTGVAVVVTQAESWHLDSFLLSCRVIGKSVEAALLAAIAADAAEAGARRLTAEYIPSGRNAPASGFLAERGFAPVGDGMFGRELGEPGLESPPWITLERAGSQALADTSDI